MNEHTDLADQFTTAELEEISAGVAEIQQEADKFLAWLQSPEGKAWTDQQLHEAIELAENFQRECTAGGYALSLAELEQLLSEGRLVKCHPIKRRWP